MHYTINNHIIKSENAALSTKQPNQWIISYISQLTEKTSILDYGCGKLRHALYLCAKCSDLTVVDSEIQLQRIQIINDNRISVLSYIEKYIPNARAISIDNFHTLNQGFDFILCTNVLSAIPSFDERRNVLMNIKHSLNSTGTALISVQYRNSYFNTYFNNPNATQYLDGWVVNNGNNCTFYGLIKPEWLLKEINDIGLKVIKRTLADGSIYLEVKT